MSLIVPTQLHGRFDKNRKIVHHTLQVADFGAAVLSVQMLMGNVVTNTSSANPGFFHSAKLRGIFVHSVCLVVDSVGSWTLRLRKNESGSDTATFSIGAAALPGSKDYGQMSADVRMDPGDTYHMLADGPERNLLIIRAVLEWEIL